MGLFVVKVSSFFQVVWARLCAFFQVRFDRLSLPTQVRAEMATICATMESPAQISHVATRNSMV
jgi:hypothetical protein